MDKACGLHCTKINNIGVKIGKDVKIITKFNIIRLHISVKSLIIGFFSENIFFILNNLSMNIILIKFSIDYFIC